MGKVMIALSPYQACTLKHFLRQFINDNTPELKGLGAIKKAVQEYEKELLRNISADQINEALIETEINEILGNQ